MRTALTIAGSDCSGGAGIQADIKTMLCNGVYAMSAITALTAQNTTGVTDIMEVTPEFLGKQLDMIFTDIYPDAVKIGMVSNPILIKKTAEKLKEYQAKNIVVDPVMVATSGASLMREEAVETLKAQLLPLADLLTPNIPEAEVLADMKICTEEDMITAAKKSVILMVVLSCAKEDIASKMPMTCYTATADTSGFRENGFKIRIPMVQDAPYPVPLHPIWQRDFPWKNLCSGRKTISRELWQICLILGRKMGL